MSTRNISAPTHTVGEHLTDFMAEMGLRAPTLAKRLDIPRSRMVRLLQGARCDGDMALRLSRFFGTSPQYWMNLQALRDLSYAKCSVGESIEAAVVPYVETGSSKN
ncbi:MAG: HigA family addiction module antitoxin [Maricaulis sp.]|nr:HigA family addiction module antitoxin [Maricaulis sp.]